MKKLLLLLALLLAPASALAQCNGAFPPGNFCGAGAVTAFPGPINLGILPASGMKCNGTTDDTAALQTAITGAIGNTGGAVVQIPYGICPVSSVFYNAWTTNLGALTIPGLKINGAGKGVTKLDARAANSTMVAANPDWNQGHKAQYSATATTSGTLASNTYFIQMTMNDGLGNEIRVGLPKSVSVTGPTGSITMTLGALNTGYTYNLYCGTGTPANYCSLSGQNASAVSGNQTIIITAIGGVQAFPTTKVAVWQEVAVSNLTFTNTTNLAGITDLLLFRVGYSQITHVSFFGSGNAAATNSNGIVIPNYTGDLDGSFFVTLDDIKCDTLTTWCINANGTSLEFSNFVIKNSIVNLVGTAPTNLNTPVTVSAIQNNATPTVTTTGSHNLLAGDQIAFSVTGITLSSTWYRVGTAVTSNTFNLVDLNGVPVNTTALGAFGTGTVSLSWRPPQYNTTTGLISGSGGIAYNGLISTISNTDCTQAANVCIYYSEAGSSDNATLEGIDLENTNGKGIYIASIIGGNFNQGECLSTAGGPGSTISCAQLGTGFAGGGVRNFNIAHEGSFKVRSNVTPAVGFEQFANTNLGATFADSVRVGSKIEWQIPWTDGAGQRRFDGFTFDPIPGQVLFSISAANVAQLIPIGIGGCLPIHLKVTGEWICVRISSTGVMQSGIGGLSATTTYNFFAYNSAISSSPYAIAMEVSATGVSLDPAGYYVKTGDSTRTFVGQARTDGSGNFQTSGFQVTQYPIQVTLPLAYSGGAIACPTCVLISGTAHGDSNYSILSTDRYVYTSANFTAPRTWTLPAANSLASGTTIWVQDAQNTVTSTNTLTISRAGADTIDISSTSLVITGAGGGITFTTDGVSNWGVPVQTVSTGGTGRQTLTNHAPLIGAGANPITQGGLGTNGQLWIGNTGADPAFATMSQDCAITSAGVTTCTKTNNVAFGSYATLSAGQLTNSLGANVALNNTANYFDGPSVAQGTTGTWFASGSVTVLDTGVGANIICKLWDATTVISSGSLTTTAVGQNMTMALSGVLTSPAANIRISCRDTSANTGLISFNASGNSKDSTVAAFRIN